MQTVFVLISQIQVEQWANDHLVTSKEQYDALGSHDMFVLEVHKNDAVDQQGNIVESVGFVYSTKGININNIFKK